MDSEGQEALEPINEKLRGETIEELVAEEDGSLIISFRGSAPDLQIRPIGDDVDLELEVRFL